MSVHSLIRHRVLGAALLLVTMDCTDDVHTCTSEYVYGLNVTVVGGASAGMCAVTVTATDGDYSEELICTADASACSCYGAGERAGRYVLEVMSPDELLVSEEATVRENACHVIPEARVFTL